MFAMGLAVRSVPNDPNQAIDIFGGVVITLGWGFTSPAWVGAGLALVGLAIAALFYRLEARRTPAESDARTRASVS